VLQWEEEKQVLAEGRNATVQEKKEGVQDARTPSERA